MDLLHHNDPGKTKRLLQSQWEEWVDDEDTMQSSLFFQKNDA